MKTKQVIPLNTPIYKVLPLPHSICLLSGNTIITVDITTGYKVVHTINAFDIILDLIYDKGLVYLAGIGSRPLVYDLNEKRIVHEVGIKDESPTGHSAIIKIEDHLYGANIYSEKLEIYQDNTLLRSFHIGHFIKQLLWDDHTRTLIIAAAESEDSGYLLGYRIDEQNEIHCLDVYVDCHFSVSNIGFNIDHTELLITGGFPPINIQVQSYPDLGFKKEIMSTEDYSKDLFGNETGYAFNLRHQFLNLEELLFPYSGGSLLLINYKTNEYRQLLENGETWIFIQFIENELVGVSAEGNIYLFDHDFFAPNTPAMINPIGPSATFNEVDCEQPLFKRYTIEPGEDTEDLVPGR